MSSSSPSRPAAIPPSPTSPPESGLKRRRLSDHLPQSPISPSFMSVATKSYVSSYGTSQHTDEASGRSSPPSSPRPSLARSHPPTSRPAPSLPTPAQSVTGIPGLDMLDDSDQHRDKRPRLDGAADEATDHMDVDSVTQGTNHDRHTSAGADGRPGPEAALGPQTSERLSGDGSAEHGTATMLEQLQKDMGDAFLLCRSQVEQQAPNPRQHLLAVYGLGPLLRSVARTDPRTGEKINKLRKSYEGQIKSFALAGRNKPVKGERNLDEDQPGPLRRMAGSSPWGLQPESEWQAQHGSGPIDVTPDFRAKLKQAVQMQPGTVRNNAHWEDVLGFDKPKSTLVSPAQPQPLPAPSFARLANGVIRPPPQQPSAEAKRQTRGKKRSYGDDSFVGYGEGYSEPEDGDANDYGQRKRVQLGHH